MKNKQKETGKRKAAGKRAGGSQNHMRERMNWVIRKIKVFLYLFPGFLTLGISVRVNYFTVDGVSNVHLRHGSEFRRFVEQKNLELEYPEAISYNYDSSGNLNIEFSEEGNYAVFLNIHYKRKIGTLELFTSNTIRRYGYYKESSGKQITINSVELRNTISQKRPWIIKDLLVEDILIIRYEKEQISNPIRLVSGGEDFMIVESLLLDSFYQVSARILTSMKQVVREIALLAIGKCLLT